MPSFLFGLCASANVTSFSLLVFSGSNFLLEILESAAATNLPVFTSVYLLISRASFLSWIVHFILDKSAYLEKCLLFNYV